MIGVFGGTFNPIHNAHIELALEVRKLLQLDHIRMIPCGIPAHRACPKVSPEQRYALLQTAIAPHRDLVADDLELKRSGPSYMIDTLQLLASRHAESLCLIIGVDTFRHFEKWKSWREILNLCHLIIMRRPEIETSERYSPELETFTQSKLTTNHQDLRDNAAGKIMFLHNTEIDISSSALRKKLATGQSISNMLPESVYRNIQERSLYSEIND